MSFVALLYIEKKVAGAITDIGFYESDYDWSDSDNVVARSVSRVTRVCCSLSDITSIGCLLQSSIAITSTIVPLSFMFLCFQKKFKLSPSKYRAKRLRTGKA